MKCALPGLFNAKTDWRKLPFPDAEDGQLADRCDQAISFLTFPMSSRSVH